MPSALTSPLAVALDSYSSSPDAAVQAAHEDRTLSSIHSALKKDALPWIAAKGASEANKRRLIAATFALEVVEPVLETQAADVPLVIEWGCEQIRKRLPSEAERQWHEAALALLEGLGDPGAVEKHLAHASARFPDASLWQHAKVWLADVHTLHVHPRQPLSAPAIPFPALLAAQYESLSASPTFAGDAWARIGFFYLLARDTEHARAALTRALASSGTSLDTQYLAHLFLSWMADRNGDAAAVIAELNAALAAAPHGSTAAVWLAVRHQLAGNTAAAQDVSTRSLTIDGAMDPWRLFYGGDIHRWPQHRAALRKAAQ